MRSFIKTHTADSEIRLLPLNFWLSTLIIYKNLNFERQNHFKVIQNGFYQIQLKILTCDLVILHYVHLSVGSSIFELKKNREKRTVILRQKSILKFLIKIMLLFTYNDIEIFLNNLIDKKFIGDLTAYQTRCSLRDLATWNSWKMLILIKNIYI